MNKIKLISLLTILVLLTACGNKEEASLDDRVAEFWKYKTSQDFIKAYEFLTPGRKKIESMQSYIVRMTASKINWTKGVLDKKECNQPDSCNVIMIVTYEYDFKIPGAGAEPMVVESPANDRWILKNNTWYINK